jgi:hypothetical protein
LNCAGYWGADDRGLEFGGNLGDLAIVNGDPSDNFGALQEQFLAFLLKPCDRGFTSGTFAGNFLNDRLRFRLAGIESGLGAFDSGGGGGDCFGNPGDDLLLFGERG